MLQSFLQASAAQGAVYQTDYHMLGKGSNLLFRDAGYPGCLIDVSKLKQLHTLEQTQHQWALDAQAGVGMGQLLTLLRKKEYTGFEFVFGIPGSIGGGIRMNAGTPDGWFSDVLTSVYGYDPAGQWWEKKVTPQDFQYRDFPWGRDLIIAGGHFLFRKSDRASIEAKLDAAKLKRKRQPLQYPNFGSVFKNPKGHFAGALIEGVGLKGCKRGQAEIADKHANFIINHGQAKTSDVCWLMSSAQQAVQEKYDVSLETEVHILGVDPQ
jgi:UDP-N-acetylmuramate dehydrogenase